MKEQVQYFYINGSKWTIQTTKEEFKLDGKQSVGLCVMSLKSIKIQIRFLEDDYINTLIHELQHAIKYELHIISGNIFLDIKSEQNKEEFEVCLGTSWLISALHQLGYGIINMKEGK